MAGGANDSTLEALREVANGAVFSAGVGVTVVAGSARIEGTVASQRVYSQYFRKVMAAAFRERAVRERHERARDAAEAAADTLDESRIAQREKRRLERRVEIAERLGELAAGDPEVDELKGEDARLAEQPAVLVLQDARVWAPVGPPVDVPFVRVPVAAIAAWWLGRESDTE